MKFRLILLLLAAQSGAALAQYKCTGANGAVTFQQTPCFGAKSEEKLVVVPNGHPPPASGASAPRVAPATATPVPARPVVPSVDKRMLENYERQHEREALEQAVKAAQDDKAQRATQRAQAAAAVRKQFGDDPNNAATLRDALAAIDSRYKALGEIDDSRIQSAQRALGEWNAQQAKAAADATARQ